MNRTKNIFLTEDIHIQYFQYNNPDRYTFARNKYQFVEFLKNTEIKDDKLRIETDIADQLTMNELIEKYPKEWEEWQDKATQEEIYEIPMMNALRYFPPFIDFKEEDCEKAVGNATLLYDDDEENGGWAVGMTGGGMDLSPDLLATFINLGHGVPLELAFGIRRDYPAYVSRELHEANCDLLAQAFLEYGHKMFNYALSLDPSISTETTKRHLKGLQKSLKAI